MAYLLGLDTGGTYTDAVILDDAADRVIAQAKALTSRPDLSVGVGQAIDAVLGDHAPQDIALVSLSTTLATNALVEGQGGRVALIFIGFAAAELQRDGLQQALRGDPVIALDGGHTHAGAEVCPLDTDALSQALAALPQDITGFAVAASFATRNPAHEIAARDLIAQQTGRPVTCSHDLSSALGGPKRALTAVLNARLIGMISRLIDACETHLAARGVTAPLMVVRGDGALISAAMARAKPIETILSGPAASVAGAQWLTGEDTALISDIGGTTTDVCLLRGGKPQVDPLGARVGPYRTMVEAVAIRTTGLGGDSAVHVREGLRAGLLLGPRRVMPMALAAVRYPHVVHDVLDAALAQPVPAPDGAQIVVPQWHATPMPSDPREAAVVARLAAGPRRQGEVVQTRMDAPALARLLDRGLVAIAGCTPSDAAHVLGLVDAWDGDAAQKMLEVFSRKRTGAGDRIAPDATALAEMIVAQLRSQTADVLLDAAFAEDPRDWDQSPEDLTRHALTRAGLDRHSGVVAVDLHLSVPVIGLGASAGAYYGPVGQRLGTRMILPDLAPVANAIGAVVGQVEMRASGTVTSAGAGVFIAHTSQGPQHATNQDAALALLESDLTRAAIAKAQAAGVADPRIDVRRDIQTADIEGQPMFVGAEIRVTARGRPRLAMSAHQTLTFPWA